MSDNIQQWRRMMQPARARTPAAPEQEDADMTALPVTPKRGLKPKISSYFTHHGPTVNALRPEPWVSVLNDDVFNPEMPTWPANEPYPDPSPEDLMDTIMCRLMASPNDALEPRFNGILLRIFESYRHLSDEIHRLQAQMHEELSRCNALEKRLQIASKQWSEERQDFKAEVKRLELLLVKGQRGVAEVTLARQDSLLRQKDANRRSRLEDDGLQTIFEFLERHQQYDEKAWRNQRAVMRARSPSAQMQRLSQQLMSKKSFTNVHADLPFGTPPDAMSSTLAEVSMLETRAAGPNTVSEPRSSLSAETFSTFSCVEGGPSTAIANPDCLIASEMQVIHRIAEALARRRRVDTAKVMPKLFEMFNFPIPDFVNEELTPISYTRQMPTPQSAHRSIGKPVSRSASMSKVQKQGSLVSKASGILNKLRPHPNNTNRFSFEAGDDIADKSPLAVSGHTAVNPHALRRSVSSSALPAAIAEFNIMSSCSPVQKSPRITSPLLHRRTSKIPALVHIYSREARRRQDRDFSNASLLKSIRGSEGANASGSDSGPVCSSEPNGREDIRQAALRSRAHGSATIITATLEPVHGNKVLSSSKMGGLMGENVQPMASTTCADAHDDSC